MMTPYTYPTWFFNANEGQLVVVEYPYATPKDPDTGDLFTDLSVGIMRASDDWFEYPSRREAMGGEE